MKNKLLIFAGAFLVLALVMRFVEKPVLAEIRAALMQNVDEPGRNPFAVSSGQNGEFAVPVGQRYVIEQYSVQCDVDNTTSMPDITLSNVTNGAFQKASAVAHYVQPNGFVNDHAVAIWRGTGVGHFYADPGSSFFVAGSGSGIEDCSYSASGYAIHNP